MNTALRAFIIFSKTIIPKKMSAGHLGISDSNRKWNSTKSDDWGMRVV